MSDSVGQRRRASSKVIISLLAGVIIPIALGYSVSAPLGAMTALVLALTLAFQTLKATRFLSVSISFGVCGLEALFSSITALPSITLIFPTLLLAVYIAFRRVSKRKSPLPRFEDVAMLSSLIGLTSMSLLLVKILAPTNVFSWVMYGDAMSSVFISRELNSLHPLEIFSSGQLFAAPLQFMMANFATAGYVPPVNSSGIVEALEAQIAVALIALSVGLAQLSKLIERNQSKPVIATKAFVLFVLMQSGLILGLVASNGFLSVGIAFAFYSAVLVLCYKLLSSDKIDVALSVQMIVMLGLLAFSWVLLAILVIGVILSVTLTKRIKTHRFRALVVLVPLLTVSIIVVVSRIPTVQFALQLTGFFPAISVSLFIALTGVFVFVSRNNSILNPQITFSIVLALSSAVITYAFLNNGTSVSKFLSFANAAGVTPFYYSEKLLWIAVMPFVVLLCLIILNHAFSRQGPMWIPTVALVLICSSILTLPGVLNFPWLPMTNDNFRAQLALEFKKDDSTSSRMYFNYKGEWMDSELNGWSGLSWEDYPGSPNSTGKAYVNHLTGISFWRRTEWQLGTPDEYLCRGLALLPAGSTLITSQVDIETRVKQVCQGKDFDVKYDIRNSAK